ncbi:MAG: hypothetical protein ACI85F_001304 [Bacteroidia bacterium]|jgi:hypothetical protein
MAVKFSLFKTPSHRVFQHKPLYFDVKKERKEELDRMVEEAKTGKYDSKNASTRIRQGYTGSLPGSDGLLKKEALDRRIRMILIVTFLAIVAFAIIELG